MKGGVMISLLLVLLIGFASSMANITCTIVDDKTLLEIETENNEIIYLPEEYSKLESDQEYIRERNEIFTDRATIKLISEDYIKETKKEKLFVLPKTTSSNANVKVFLPQNHILSNDLVYPKNYELSTNGQNIILEWKNNSEEIIIFYKGVSDSNILYYITIFFSLTAAVAILFLQQKKFKKELKEAKEKGKKKIEKLKETKNIQITKNLFGDEKKIIEYLLTKKGKSCWTKELVKELQIPKVRLSRKIRSLAEKDIVKKEQFGNRNKISLN